MIYVCNVCMQRMYATYVCMHACKYVYSYQRRSYYLAMYIVLQMPFKAAHQ